MQYRSLGIMELKWTTLDVLGLSDLCIRVNIHCTVDMIGLTDFETWSVATGLMQHLMQ